MGKQNRQRIKQFVLALILVIGGTLPNFYFPQPASAAMPIASNGTNTSAQTTGATSLTWSHTVASGTNRALFVELSIDGLGASVTSVRYGGADLTQVGRAAGNHAVEIWRLLSPAVGTANVVASFGATTAATGGATTFNGVNQTTPTGTFAGASGTGTTASVTASSAAGDVVIDVTNWDNNPTGYAIGSGQTQQWTQTSAAQRGVSTTKTGAASVTMSSTVSVSNQWEIGAVSIKPVANIAPVINLVGIYQTDHTTAVTSMNPQTEYAVKMTATDNDTLNDLVTVKVTIFYDSTGTYNPANIPASGSTATAAILTCAVGASPAWSIDPGSNTTWSIISGNCVQPTLSGTSGDFWFHFKPGKVATATSGSAKWHIYARATDRSAAAADNYQANRTMNWYGELSVNTPSVSWSSVTPGSGFSAGVNRQTGVSVTYIANGNYKTQVMSSATWTGSGSNAAFDNSGSCSSPGQFSLEANSTNTFPGSQVTTSSADIDLTGVQTAEAGTTVSTNTLWLKAASVFRNNTYNGTITYTIASR